MVNVIKFLMFMIYSTGIFFLPNNKIIIIFILINLFVTIFTKTDLKKMIATILKIFPFIIFTFIVNWIMDDLMNALWIGIKLVMVCNITILYSQTISVTEIAETIQLLCTPLKVFKINTDEIKVMVCISLSMIPIVKKDLYEVKMACKAKNMEFNLKNSKYILSKVFLSLIKRVNQIEEALMAKGCNY